ncbi:hypothetical protein B0T20DRAFT_351381, partial [Sordaria brevicollis]
LSSITMKAQLAVLLTALSAASAGPCQAVTTTTAPSITTTTTSSTPSITSIAASCTYTGTQTVFATTGCEIPCGTAPLCIADAAITKSCGCSTVPFTKTTITICPTRSPCFPCTSAWGTFTYTEPCSTTAAP